MFKKLRNKFLIINMVVTSLVMITAFSVVYITTYNNIKNENHEKLNSMSKSFTISSEELLNQQEKRDNEDLSNRQEKNKIVNMSSANYLMAFTLVVDKNGDIINKDSIINLPEETYYEAAKAAWKKGGSSTINLGERLWIYSITPEGIAEVYEDGGSVTNVSSDNYQISFLDITDNQKSLRDLLLTFVFVGIAMLMGIFIISLYFANHSIEPIASAWKKQQQFIADASHELKTPLSIITANYDALLSNEDETIRSQREWFDYMKIGTDRMGRLINSLLSLAKMEDINVDESKEPFNMSETIIRDMAAMEAALLEKDISLSQSIQKDVFINSNQEMIRQVFMILFENAIKYSNLKGEIFIYLKKEGHRVICSIKNSGKGIDRKDLPKVFDRFYRAEKSRTGENGGFGLGLSIAKAIINGLGGGISAESIENEWTVFTFTLKEAL